MMIWNWIISLLGKIVRVVQKFPSYIGVRIPQGSKPFIKSAGSVARDMESEWRPEVSKEGAFRQALVVLTEQGFDPMIVYTHAYHESGGFNKIIGEWNFWGIKKPGNWKGKVHEVNTHEYIKGFKVAVKDVFIDFATVENAMLWYGDLIFRLYKKSWNNRHNYTEYFKGLVSGKYKYATDPKYSEKLCKLYEQLRKEVSL